MIVRNKKNGTNVLAFGSSRVIIKAGEIVNIPSLVDFNQIINKADFTNRGWFEIVEMVEKNEVNNIVIKETNLEKAKKEVEEYTINKKNNEE